MREKSIGNRPGPDFICIGQQKAGTGWLYDQLNAHQSVWMPPIKELNYFCGNPFRDKYVDWANEYHASQNNIFANAGKRLNTILGIRQEVGTKRSVDSQYPELDHRFWSIYRQAASSRANNPDWYLSLFDIPKVLTTGDISPGYSAANLEQIQHAKKLVPDARIILLVRNPVSRAKSAISMAIRSGRFSPGFADDWEAICKVISGRSFTDKSLATRIWSDWASVFGEAQCRYWLMDDLIENPTITRRAILEFLGLCSSEPPLPPGHNRKANQKKVEFSPEINDRLQEYYRDEISKAADLFGGAARDW